MTFSSLAFRNAKKSYFDYSIYFLTLTFGICLFYMFNSIESQTAMMALSDKQSGNLMSISTAMEYISALISVILAFLIIYSNGYLIRRRKKEFGIYMVLGMNRRKISLIIMLETLVIGIFAMATGLVLGIFCSHGLSIVTAKMFMVNMKNFEFIFSFKALIRTLVYFGGIFVIVMVFNMISISRIKLINLLYSSRKNQVHLLKSSKVDYLLFILSIVSLGTAYYLINKNSFANIDADFRNSIILGIVGTVLFFMSVSNIVLRLIKSNKSVYLRGLNMFVTKQISNKINTSFISMSIICIMLLISIGTLATGVGLSQVLNNNIKERTTYDAVYIGYYDYDNNHEKVDIIKSLVEKGFDMDAFIDRYAQVDFYETDIDSSSILSYSHSLDNSYTSYYQAISISSLNKLRQINGLEPVSLSDDSFMIIIDKEDIIRRINSNGVNDINIDGNIIKFKELNRLNLENQMWDDYGVLVLSNKNIENLKLRRSSVDLFFKEDNELVREMFYNAVSEHKTLGNLSYIYGSTKYDLIQESLSGKTLVSFIGIYVGIIFMISSVVILAIQQLSEVNDNVERYRLLKDIGADKKMVTRAVFIQVSVYFMTPLILSIVHSAVGIYVVNRVISMIGNLDVARNSLYLFGFIITIYGGYFFATFISTKKIVDTL